MDILTNMGQDSVTVCITALVITVMASLLTPEEKDPNLLPI